MRASGATRVPSVLTTAPSTLTQPFSIQSSASRREQRPSSLIRFDNLGFAESAVGAGPASAAGAATAFARAGDAAREVATARAVTMVAFVCEAEWLRCIRRWRDVGGWGALAGLGPLRGGSFSVGAIARLWLRRPQSASVLIKRGDRPRRPVARTRRP